MKLVIMTNIGRHMRERPINYTTPGRICQALFFRHFIQKNRPLIREGEIILIVQCALRLIAPNPLG